MLTKTGTALAAVALTLLAGTSAASAQGRYYYGEECHEQNKTAGTVLGAIAGGIIGNQFGSGGGKAAATVGGVILGGALGNKIGSDIDCQDRPYAFRAYNDSFNGRVGHRYDWRGRRGARASPARSPRAARRTAAIGPRRRTAPTSRPGPQWTSAPWPP